MEFVFHFDIQVNNEANEQSLPIEFFFKVVRMGGVFFQFDK
jgi:hypothetical protein